VLCPPKIPQKSCGIFKCLEFFKQYRVYGFSVHRSAFWGQRSEDSLQKTGKKSTQSELCSLLSVYWHPTPET